MKKIFLMSIFMLSGCIYEQCPAPINSVDVVKPINKVQPPPPTSYSYPLPERPTSINNVVVNEPLSIPNKNIESNEVVIDNNQIEQNSNSNVVDQVVSDAVSNKPIVNSEPVGSFNNPIKFDPNKAY